MPVDNLAAFEAHEVLARTGVTNRADVGSSESMAAAARLENKRKAKTATEILREEEAKSTADKVQIKPDDRITALDNNFGKRVPGQDRRDRPAGSPSEMRHQLTTDQAVTVEKFINTGYDALTPIEKTALRDQVARAVAKHPTILALLDDPAGAAATDARRQEAYATFLRNSDNRAKIRTAYEATRGLGGLELPSEDDLKAQLTTTEDEIAEKQKAIREITMQIDEAQDDISKNVLPPGAEKEDVDAQTKFKEKEASALTAERAARDASDTQMIAENKLKEFREQQVDASSGAVIPGGERWQALQRAQTTLNDSLYSEDAVRTARITKTQEDDNVARLDLRIQDMNKLPAKSRASDHTTELGRLEQLRLDAQIRARNAQAIIDARVDAQAVRDTFESDRINAQNAADTAIDNKSQVDEALAEAKQRLEAARKRRAGSGETVDKLYAEWNKLEEDLAASQTKRSVQEAGLEQGQIRREEKILEQFSTVVERGTDAYIKDQQEQLQTDEDIFLEERLAQENSKVMQALLRMYKSRWTEEGMRGIANIPGLRNIRLRPASVPREAVIHQDLEQLFENGENLPNTLRYMLNQYMLWQRAESVAVPPPVGAAPGAPGTSRLLDDHLLTQEDINAFLSNKDATNSASQEMAGRILAARLALGRLNPREADLVSNLVSQEWAKAVFNNADKIIKENRSLNEALRRNGITQREVMDYARRAIDSKNSTGLITLLALLIGGVVPAGVAWYAMSQRGQGQSDSAPVDVTV